MTTIEHLQALKRSLDTAIERSMGFPKTEYVGGMRSGLDIAIKAIEQEIKMIEAGEGEKA